MESMTFSARPHAIDALELFVLGNRHSPLQTIEFPGQHAYLGLDPDPKDRSARGFSHC